LDFVRRGVTGLGPGEEGEVEAWQVELGGLSGEAGVIVRGEVLEGGGAPRPSRRSRPNRCRTTPTTMAAGSAPFEVARLVFRT